VRAAVFSAPGKLEFLEVESPKSCRENEVEISIEACGICGTDLHVLEIPPGHPGNVGVIMGHEFVGRVTARGSAVLEPKIGGRVVVEANIACGMCKPCKIGMTSQCLNFTTHGIFRDGGMADKVVVLARTCHEISDDLSADVAALAEPLSCVINGILTARPTVGDSVAVIGGGAIGLLYTAIFRLSGASEIVVIEPADDRRQIATAMGATSAIHPKDLSEDLKQRFDIVVDAVGSQLEVGIQLARSGGQVLLFGMNSTKINSIHQFEITRRELRIHGVYVGSYLFPRAIRILEKSGIDFSPMISTYPFERVIEAVENLRVGKDIKAILIM
jgi:threonine dehydrogenase-like Zn-dependent dehydrogenase